MVALKQRSVSSHFNWGTTHAIALMAPLVAIKYERGQLRLLDQRRLPFEEVWLDVPTPQDAWQQIKDMVVRGAPVR